MRFGHTAWHAAILLKRPKELFAVKREELNMQKLRTHISLAILLLCCSVAAHAQKATEQFIPIGQSPGLSGKHTLIARIEAVSPPTRTLTLKNETGTHTVRITEQTKIWLDRSRLQQPNVKGTFADCSVGSLAEIKFLQNERKEGGVAEWAKVQVN